MRHSRIKQGKARDVPGNRPGSPGEGFAVARRKPAGPIEDRLRPWLLAALVALLVARPMLPSEAVATAGDGLPLVMLWITLAAFWLVGQIGRARFFLRFGWIDASVLLLIVLHTLAAAWGAKHGSPRPAVNMLWEWVALGLTFFLVRQLVVYPRDCRAVVAVMIALAVGLSGYGLYQYFYEMPQTRAAYEADPDETLRGAGLWFPPGSPERQIFETRLGSSEPLATFALTNSLAGFLTPWLVLLAGVLLCRAAWCGEASAREAPEEPCTRDRASGDSRRHWLLLIPAAAMATCLLLTHSRSAFIAVLAGMAAVWWIGRRGMRSRWKIIAVATGLAAILVGGATLAGALDHELFSRALTSMRYRVEYWRASLAIIADHPLLGCGPGNFQEVYTQYKLPEAAEEVADPHNFLVEVAATAGIPALLALLAVLGGVLYRQRAASVQPLPNQGIAEQSFCPHVVLGALAGMLLSLPLGTFSAAPPGNAMPLVVIPLAIGTMALLWPWVDRGALPHWLPAVAAGALMVNLLAAGGIGFPGVAGSLWLLLALALVGAQPRTPRRSAGVVGLLAVVGLAIACYASAYDPVLRCLGAMRRAQQAWAAGQAAAAEQHLLAAATADALAAEPWRRLAAVALEHGRHKSKSGWDFRFAQYQVAALRRSPNSALAWLMAGEGYLEAHGLLRRRDLIDRAVDAYARAVRLYPNHGLYHAKLAIAYQIAGRQEDFRREARVALDLDDVTPHPSQKLAPEIRTRMEAAVSS